MISVLAKQLLMDVTEGLSNAKDGASGPLLELQQQLQVHIESRLRQMNLVTREEFDAQSAVLQRTRQQLDHLHQQLEVLEQQLQAANLEKHE